VVGAPYGMCVLLAAILFGTACLAPLWEYFVIATLIAAPCSCSSRIYM
jgi:hypothetical protein